MTWHWWFRDCFNGGGIATMPMLTGLAVATVVAIIFVRLHSFILLSSSSTTSHHPHWNNYLGCLLMMMLPAAKAVLAILVHGNKL